MVDLATLVPAKELVPHIRAVLTRLELQEPKYFKQLGTIVKKPLEYRWRPGNTERSAQLSPAAAYIWSLRTQRNKGYYTTLDVSNPSLGAFSREELLDALFEQVATEAIELSDKAAQKPKVPEGEKAPKAKTLIRLRQLQPCPTVDALRELVNREHKAIQDEANRVKDRQLLLLNIMTNPQQCVHKTLLEHFNDSLPGAVTRCEHCFWCLQNPGK